eukprot:CAMPEP_0170543304 /NCGR_PEP_ID=MMETSP0211-20121228/2463_1 /TAXON_ID=311385 /ORGANISM="Pseudokeronopsis sp., Strain OXSARD2" /LENGTH=165 /DNA_ID=CAMNT_0010846639 /DNA_START=1839 /DNA_END=2336 /DNA_ORIENTATION=+
MSVIIGVMQMGTGICMKALNALYFKRYLDFFHEFIPQILLLLLLFGYMDLLIIIKWLTNYSGHEYQAPSIITTMINIPLAGGYIKGKPFIGSSSTNQALSILFFTICMVCVPWMLFVKPYILRKRMKKHDYQSKLDQMIEMEDFNANKNHGSNYNQFVEEEEKKH